ncbi:MAG: type II toxin-antitoxin system antitoxin SocA domain-containing protein [Pseudomonadota bacterium]
MFDRDKFKSLIHHVIWRTQDRDGWGLTKTFKALWFFEARRYALNHETFSGARYIRDEFGPRPQGAYPLLSEMEAEERIRRYDEPYYSKTLKRAKALRPPPSDLLTEGQSRDLEYWIRYIDGMTAGEISEESHDYGWEIAVQGEELPLHALMAHRARDPDEEELEWARAEAARLGLP